MSKDSTNNDEEDKNKYDPGELKRKVQESYRRRHPNDPLDSPQTTRKQTPPGSPQSERKQTPPASPKEQTPSSPRSPRK